MITTSYWALAVFRVKRRMKNERSYLIEKLRAFKDMRTVILMCYWE